MASASIIYDTRNPKKDKTNPIVIRIIHNRKMTSIKTGYSCLTDDWDEGKLKIKQSKDFSNAGRANSDISNLQAKASNVIEKNEKKLHLLSIDELRNLILDYDPEKEKKNEEAEENRNYFLKYGYEVVDRLIAESTPEKDRTGTAGATETALNCFKKFLALRGLEDIKFSDLDHKVLQSFETDCLSGRLKGKYKKKACGINGLATYLRHLRTVINLAIADELMLPEKYPFRKYKIKRQKPQKRAVKKTVLGDIRKQEYEKGSVMWHNKNYLFFMFNARGMNFIDLSRLRVSNISKDRISYIRRKTKRVYDIKLTQEAKDILQHYLPGKKETDYVFPIMADILDRDDMTLKEKGRSQADRLKQHNKYLKKIGGSTFTSYVIRHSWATIAKYSNVPTSVIKEGLGHEDEATTQSYLDDFENEVLDDVNEMVVNATAEGEKQPV